ncbi:MAG: hypothetical protein ACJAZP_001950 [Psychromonas sp.]|jgi:hypothetical protein|uniref:glycosyl transferase family 90 n=1 Tax=Psychromonas sp. TaxID=1884585 RepID=UPI0039E43635
MISPLQRKKIKYYFLNTLSLLLPSFLYRFLLIKKLQKLSLHDAEYLWERVNYYNKIKHSFIYSQDAIQISDFKKDGGTAYFFDFKKIIRHFPRHLKVSYLFGDVITVPQNPVFVKSRPILSDNKNSILLKLNSIRHYNFVDDSIPYQNKKDQVVWRGAGFRQHRLDMLNQFYLHPLCNVGRVDFEKKSEYDTLAVTLFKSKMTIPEQLQYKFILSIEGKDVATNLKWIMSSNSLCLMIKPKFETWFMEGLLEAGVHYVELKDDYSDLIEKMQYYLEYEEQALQIIKNANNYVEQFKDEKREQLIQLLVAQKYFQQTGQF